MKNFTSPCVFSSFAGSLWPRKTSVTVVVMMVMVNGTGAVRQPITSEAHTRTTVETVTHRLTGSGNTTRDCSAAISNSCVPVTSQCVIVRNDRRLAGCYEIFM